MKKLHPAVIALVLAPALALAEAAPAPAPAPEGTQAPAQHSGTVQQSDAPADGSASSSSSTSQPADASAQPAATATAAAPAAPKKKSALANAVQARTPEEQARQSGFQFFVQLDHNLGAGTFVDAQLYSYLAASVTVAPRYLFAIGGKRVVASATLALGYEYTMPDVATGRKVSYGDLRLGLSSPALFVDKAFTGIAFSPNVGLTVPTSPESWNAGMITAVSAGVTMSRQVKMFDFIGSIGGARSFYTNAVSGVRPSDARDGNGNLVVICRPGETVCGFSGMNPAWSFNIGLNVQWRATGSLMVYAGYRFFKNWRHAAASTVDEFTPKALDANGNPVADTGPGQSDRTSTFVGASYQLNEHYSLDLGVSNAQAPLHDDNVNVRFPFLSLGAWANNNTTFYFTLTAAY